MKVVKNNRITGDLHLLLFLILIFGGFSLFIGDADISFDDTKDLTAENFSLGEEAILPRLNEIDLRTYHYQLQTFQLSAGHFSNSIIPNCEDIINGEFTFINHFYNVSYKVPIYILYMQQRISDDDVVPLLSSV
jgi:hypothetical protein